MAEQAAGVFTGWTACSGRVQSERISLLRRGRHTSLVTTAYDRSVGFASAVPCSACVPALSRLQQLLQQLIAGHCITEHNREWLSQQNRILPLPLELLSSLSRKDLNTCIPAAERLDGVQAFTEYRTCAPHHLELRKAGVVRYTREGDSSSELAISEPPKNRRPKDVNALRA